MADYLYKVPYYDYITRQKLGTCEFIGTDRYSEPSYYGTDYGDAMKLTGAFNRLGLKYGGMLYIDPSHLSVPTFTTKVINECGMEPFIDVYPFKGKSIEFVYYDKDNTKLSIVIEFSASLDSGSHIQMGGAGYLHKNGVRLQSSPNIAITVFTRYITEGTAAIADCTGYSLPIINYENSEYGYPFLGYGSRACYRERSAGGGDPIVDHFVQARYERLNWYQEPFDDWISGYQPVEYDDDNPYFDGGTSGESDSEGNFSEESDDVDLDHLPTYDAVDTGFATLFTPTRGQLKTLSGVLWDSNIFTALQNLVENIQDLFTSLSIVPFNVTQGSTVEVTWLGLPTGNILLTLAAAQYYEFNMGSIDLGNDSRIYTSGSALDYSPFSKLGIFLPFIGFQDLDIDECRGSVLNLKYRIDILSGTCVAIISINGNPIYQFSGNCLSQIPITNENMQSLVTDAVQVGIAAAATHAAAGAASADMTAAEGVKNTAVKEAKMAHAEAHVASSQGHLASATANAAMGMKPTFGKAGAISASASLLAVKQPYLFLTTPRQSIPDHYQRYCGFPSNISGKLNTFSGFTVVEDIRLNGLVATSPEVSEIYQLLKSGVII